MPRRPAAVLHGTGQPFSQCAHRSARLRFVEHVLGLIDDRPREAVTPATPLTPATPATPPLPDSEALARWLAARRPLDVEPVPPRAGDLAYLRPVGRAAAAGRCGTGGAAAAGLGHRQVGDRPAPVRAPSCGAPAAPRGKWPMSSSGLEFFHRRPDLELHYPGRVPDLWKEDLRTATFLIRRNDDTFGFAHTSLREYFLARHLGRAPALPPEQARERWQLPVPSPETLDFLGQWLAGRDTAQRGRRTAALAALAARTPACQADAAAVLAFAYSLAAARGGHPSHHPAGSRLPRADLTGAVLRDVDLSGTDPVRREPDPGRAPRQQPA